ncbi:MAG TPA: hypothetical protein VGS19_25535 [Streptosporangiaceae bacterium]|nr:hypothetical protein [Streptosporangiaceae bacterium]
MRRRIMNPCGRWAYVVTAVAVAVVAVSSIVAAVRQSSWGPIVAVGWLPAVVAGTWWPGTRRRCLPRRSGQVG